MTWPIHSQGLCQPWGLPPDPATPAPLSSPSLPSCQAIPGAPWPHPLLHPQLSSMARMSMRLRRSLIVIWGITTLSTSSSGKVASYNSWEVHRQVHARPKIAMFHHNNPSTAWHINAAISNSIPSTRADLVTSWRFSHVMMLCLWRGGDVRGSLSIPPYLSFIHSCLYPCPILYVHIQSSCINFNVIEPTSLCWCIHSWQSCDVDDFAQHGHLCNKTVTFTSDILV
jgi:hypothetical protein